MIKSNAVSWTATFGLVPGYRHGNDGADSYRNDLVRAWDRAMNSAYDSTGFVVSCVVQNTVVLYPERLGCPNGGEEAITLSGSSNPDFVSVDQIDEFKAVVLDVVKKVQEEMNQTTVRVEFTEIESHYLVRR